jgi:hypothetical protein
MNYIDATRFNVAIVRNGSALQFCGTDNMGYGLPGLTIDYDLNAASRSTRICGPVPSIYAVGGLGTFTGIGIATLSALASDARCATGGGLLFLSGLTKADACPNKNSNSIEFNNFPVSFGVSEQMADGSTLFDYFTSNLVYTGSGGAGTTLYTIPVSGEGSHYDLCNPTTSAWALTAGGGQNIVTGGVASSTGSIPAKTCATLSTYQNGGTYFWGITSVTGSGGAGTVTSVAMTVPSFLSITGSPITTSGTLAVGLSGTALPISSGGTGATTLAGANIVTWTGGITTTHCAEWSATGILEDSGAGCGGGGSSAFSSLTSGTNTTMAAVCGTGCSIAVSGSGTNQATSLTALTGLPTEATATVLANTSGSTASASAVTLPNFQAAMIAANAQLVTDSPAAGPINDYNASGNFNTATAILYLTPTTGGTTLDGLVAGSSMQQVFIINAEAAGGADQIFLANQSASDSTAANRFLTAATNELGIPAGAAVDCIYLTSSINRWWCH